MERNKEGIVYRLSNYDQEIFIYKLLKYNAFFAVYFCHCASLRTTANL